MGRGLKISYNLLHIKGDTEWFVC